ERESQAGALSRALRLPARLLELLEDPLAILVRDPDARVRDTDNDVAVTALGADCDAATIGGELHGVGQKVEHDLLDLPGIGLDQVDVWCHIERERDVVARGALGSCDIVARNSLLCRLATSSWRLLSWISLKRRTFSIAIAA